MKRVFCLVLALFIFVGCTSAPPKEPVSPYSRALSNENATNEAVALYNYICETYHTAIISGQQDPHGWAVSSMNSTTSMT